MKKCLSVLLTALIFVSMFAVSASAYSAFDIPETDGNIYGFLYKINDEVFFSDYESIKELAETKETTVYLPEECNGKRVKVDMVVYEYGSYSAKAETTVPGSVSSIPVDENKSEYRINFVCSEDAEYDVENQIGTSSVMEYFGYVNYTTGKAVFLNQEEMDTLISTKELSIEDSGIKVFDEVSFVDYGADSSGGKEVTSFFVNKIECERLFNNDADKYRVVINENASIFDDNCLIGMFKDVFKMIFEMVANFIRYS